MRNFALASNIELFTVQSKKLPDMKSFALLPLFTLSLIMSLSACKNPQEITEPVVIESVPSAELVTDMNAYGGSAPTGINKVTITGNKMSIQVKYSGGCEKHEFKLVGNKMISKSIPAQRSIKLYHNNYNDSCRELIEETLVFEISAFAYDDNEIVLRLDGYETPIRYLPLR